MSLYKQTCVSCLCQLPPTVTQPEQPHMAYDSHHTHTHRVKVWADKMGVERSKPDEAARIACREKQLSVGSLHFTPHAGV